MSDMTQMNEDLKEFKEYYSVSAKLINDMSKDDLAECARLMALQIADYRQRFGDIPNRDLLGLLGVESLTSEQYAATGRDGNPDRVSWVRDGAAAGGRLAALKAS
jgi:hypothetical protein